MHHLIADRQSVSIVLRELAAVYKAEMGHGAVIPEGRSDQVALAMRQHEQFRKGYDEPGFKYWQGQWDAYRDAQVRAVDVKPAQDIPLEARTCERQVYRVNVDESLSKRLSRFVGERGITLYMLCLGAFGLEIAKSTGNKRVAIWANFANRKDSESEAVVGWRVNSHILALDVAADVSVWRYLDSVRETVVSALEYQHCPLAALWCLNGQCLASSEGIAFDLLESLNTSVGADVRGGGHRVRPIAVPHTPVRVLSGEARLRALVNRHKLTLSLQYAADYFSANAMSGIVDGTVKAMARMIEDPFERIANL